MDGWMARLCDIVGKYGSSFLPFYLSFLSCSHTPGIEGIIETNRKHTIHPN